MNSELFMRLAVLVLVFGVACAPTRPAPRSGSHPASPASPTAAAPTTSVVDPPSTDPPAASADHAHHHHHHHAPAPAPEEPSDATP